jgi:hypothetical protein
MSRSFSRHFLRLLAPSFGAAFLATACSDAPPVVREADTGPLVADSAGIRIVEETAPAWGTTPQWIVGDSFTVDIGEPTQPLVGVPPVFRLSDGRIVVANGATQSILFFDPTGKLLTTAGGRGTEEGQFHGLGWIGRGPADTVVAYDFLARRLVIFDAKGKYVRVAALAPADPKIAAEPLATYPDGSVLFRLGRPANPFTGKQGEVIRDSASYMRFGLDGLPYEALGRFPQGETWGVRIRPDGPLSPFPVPFGLVTVAALRADTMLIGTGARFEVASIGPDGKSVGLLRAPIERATVTPEMSREYSAAAVTRLRTGAKSLNTPLDSTLIRSLEKAPFPAQMPAFGRMLVDRTGALWLSAPLNPPASASTWNVFAPDGQWLGAVTTPDGLRVDEIGTDYVVGVWRQRHGQEHVRVYPLSRGAGS